MLSLDDETGSRLLRFVRTIIEAHLTGASSDRSRERPAWSASLPNAGAFVTLRNGPHLRGCIGTFDATDPLIATLERMAVASLGDPRFHAMPVSFRELSDIRIELSLVSPMTPIADPLSLTIGVHGIYVRRGHRTGCFLPDVATEQEWSVEEFLSECCAHKAGLPPDAWRSSETQVHVFTVQKFVE